MKATEQGETMNKIQIEIDNRPRSPHRKILDRIPYGSQNAVSMRDLARGLGEDPRQIRHRIEQARIAGNIIAGTDAGIFIPTTVEELREYVRRNEQRVKTSCVALAPAKRLLKEVDCDEDE